MKRQKAPSKYTPERKYDPDDRQELIHLKKKRHQMLDIENEDDIIEYNHRNRQQKKYRY